MRKVQSYLVASKIRRARSGGFVQNVKVHTGIDLEKQKVRNDRLRTICSLIYMKVLAKGECDC